MQHFMFLFCFQSVLTKIKKLFLIYFYFSILQSDLFFFFFAGTACVLVMFAVWTFLQGSAKFSQMEGLNKLFLSIKHKKDTILKKAKTYYFGQVFGGGDTKGPISPPSLHPLLLHSV